MPTSGERSGIPLPSEIVTNDYKTKQFLMDQKDAKGGWHTVPTFADLTANTWDGVMTVKRTKGMVAVVEVDETDGGNMNVYQMTNSDATSPVWEKKDLGGTSISLSNPQVVDDLTARDALSPTANDFVNVVDARNPSDISGITNADPAVIELDVNYDIIEGSLITIASVGGMSLPDGTLCFVASAICAETQVEVAAAEAAAEAYADTKINNDSAMGGGSPSTEEGGSESAIQNYVADQISLSGGGTSVLMQTATIEISAAEMLTIKDSPKVLVAAQGEGTIIIFHKLFVKYTYGAATYAGDVDTYVALDTTAKTVVGNNYNVSAGADSFDIISPVTISTSSTDMANKDLILTNATSNPTTGDGTFQVVVEYSVITL